MAGPIATLRVMLSADDAELRKGLGRSDKATKKWAATQKRRSEQVSKAMRGVATAAIAVAGSFAALTKVAVEYADKLGKTADKLGLTVEELQKYRYAAEQAGINTRTLDMSMQRFTRRLGEAQNGTGVLHKTLVQLGIAVRNNDGSLRSTEAVLYDYAEAIQSAEGQSEKLRLAFVAFDSEGAAMVNMLKNGSSELKGLAEQMQAAGLIMSEETTKKAAELNDKFGAMSQILKNELYTSVIDLAHSALPFLINYLSVAEFGIRTLQSATLLVIASFEKLRYGATALAATVVATFTTLGRSIASGLAKLPYQITKMWAQAKLAVVNGISSLAAAGDSALSSTPKWLQNMMGYEAGSLASANSQMAEVIRAEIAAADNAISAINTARSSEKPTALESLLWGSAEQADANADELYNKAVAASERAHGALMGQGIASKGAAIVGNANSGGAANATADPKVTWAKKTGDAIVEAERKTQERLRALRETSYMQSLDILKGWVGANSKAGMAITAVQEGIAIANVIMSGAEAASAAWKSGNPFQAALIIASSAAQVATSISTIKGAGKGVKGQFHDGIDNVPSTGTYLLEQGERVVDKRLNADLKSALGGGGDAGLGGGGNTVSITVNGVADAATINRVITEQRPQFEQMFRDINQDRAGQGLL